MFAWIRKSIKNKILLTILAVVVVTGLAMIFLIYSLTANALTSQKKDSMHQATVSEALNISQKLDQAQAMIKTMAEDPCTTLYLTGQPITMDINDSLNVHVVDGFITDIGLAKMDGTVVTDTNKAFIGKNYSKEPFFRKAIAGESSIIQVVDIENKSVKYYAFSPAKMKDGKISGVVFASILPDTLYSGLTSTTLHDVGDLMIVDSDGIVLYSTASEDMYKSLWTLFDTEKEDIRAKYGTQGAKIDSMEYEVAKDKIKNYGGSSIFDFNCAEDKGESEMMAIARVGQYPFFLSTELETEKVTAAAVRNAEIMAGVGASIILVAILIFSYVLTRFLRPLKALKNVVESISRGNLDQDIHIETKDEFHELGDVIAKMTMELKEKSIIEEKRKKAYIDNMVLQEKKVVDEIRKKKTQSK